MTIPAIGAISAASSALPTSATSLTSAIDPTGAASATSSTSGSDFAAMLSKGLDAVSSSQSKADTLAVGAATGNLTDIQNYTVAASQASIVTELATAIQSKGLAAFNQIMGMQA